MKTEIPPPYGVHRETRKPWTPPQIIRSALTDTQAGQLAAYNENYTFNSSLDS